MYPWMVIIMAISDGLTFGPPYLLRIIFKKYCDEEILL